MARSSPFITMGKENGCEMTLSSKRRGVSTALIEYFASLDHVKTKKIVFMSKESLTRLRELLYTLMKINNEINREIIY